MPSLEMYREHAPECARGILNQWGQLHRARVQCTEDLTLSSTLHATTWAQKSSANNTSVSKNIGDLKGKLDAEIAAARAD
jgi:hypothetical protein